MKEYNEFFIPEVKDLKEESGFIKNSIIRIKYMNGNSLQIPLTLENISKMDEDNANKAIEEISCNLIDLLLL